MKLETDFLTVRAAAEYLGCSKDELVAWVEPDRRLPGDVGPDSGARLWRHTTLDAARSHVEAWRARDRLAVAAQRRELEIERLAQKQRRAGMRKGGARLAGKVREALGCTLAELNRWASDGRLPPDGEIFLDGSVVGKAINARAWLPASIEAAKDRVAAWREQDKIAARQKLKLVRPAPVKNHRTVSVVYEGQAGDSTDIACREVLERAEGKLLNSGTFLGEPMQRDLEYHVRADRVPAVKEALEALGVTVSVERAR
jgi:hypothetical protein